MSTMPNQPPASRPDLHAISIWLAHGWQNYHDAVSAGTPFDLPTYSPAEVAFFKAIDENPEAAAAVHHFLEVQAQSDQMQKVIADDGTSMRQDPATLATEGLGLAVGLGNGLGMYIAVHAYPDDPAMQNHAAMLIGGPADALYVFSLGWLGPAGATGRW
jgi:hypothetical protein